MKKIIASAVGLMMFSGVAVTTASAVENKFGGYWRTRIFYQDEFKPGQDYFRADNRSRLYYTAKFSDDFKFVNKFEFNSNWGDGNGGDIGADGDTFRVKNSYMDANFGATRLKLGIQAAVVARGFIFDDDFSGAMATMDMGGASVTPLWISVDSEDAGGKDFDRNHFGVIASIKASDAVSIAPYFIYDTASSGSVTVVDPITGIASTTPVGDIDNYYVGADVDMKMDAVSVWGSLIYNSAEIQDADTDDFLVAAGVDAGVAHGQAIYAGEEFIASPGSSYYWSEILGKGTFDNAVPGGPGNNITNVVAFNAGVTLKPADKMKIVLDAWYAFLAEEDAAGEDELGLELDGKLSYKLMDNLTADLVLAYLVAGEAVGDDDALETGVRISLKF